ncbi:MAG TPA: hypothetical protein VHC95_02205 [Opitutales bacterium]|nr:hypothetical protein [Opitutales bacterium]
MKTLSPLAAVVFVSLMPAAMAQLRPGGAAPRPNFNPAPAQPGNAAPSQPAAAPAQPAGTPPPASGTSAGLQTSTDPQNSNVWTLADKILNSDSLGVDSENGIFTWHNSKFNVGDNLALNARFERYLSSPGFPDTTQTYQQVLKQIETRLAPDPGVDGNFSQDKKNEQVYEAWQLLADAAKYPEDGGASAILANQVLNAWRVRAELSNNRAEYDAIIAKEREKLKDSGLSLALAKGSLIPPGQAPGGGGGSSGNRNGSNLASAGRSNSGSNNSGSNSTNSSSGNYLSDGVLNIANTTSSIGSGNNQGSSSSDSTGGLNAGTPGSSTNPADALNGLTQPLGGLTSALGTVANNQVSGLGGVNGPSLTPLMQDNADLMRLYLKENLLDADATSMGLQAKLQYQTQLLAFIAQRHFQHSLIAGEFYEHLFKGSQQRMNVAQEEMARYFNTDNVVPSVNSFEFISHEAIADVDSGMRSVEAAYDAGDRWTALEQLKQTFLLGENLPSVQQFEPAKRRVLLAIYRNASILKHTMEARDYATAEETVKNIQAEAKDFEAAPVLSAIKEAEQTSTSYVLAAGQAAMSGDTDRVTDSLQKATQLWPLNPEINNFSKGLLDRTNLQNVGTQKFDDLYANHDDRAIFDSRDEIGLAVYQDPDRSAKLKAILSRMGQVEMAIAFADQALKQNNGYAAWETLQSAADIEPNDPVLARSMRTVAPRVPNFVAALDSADRATKAGDYAVALNYYLEAQDLYPASRICSDAIADLSAKLMARLNPRGPSAKSLAQKQAVQSAASPSAASAPAPTPPAESKPVAKADTNS